MQQLLSDSDIHRFLSDGVLLIEPDVDLEIHARIDKQIRHALENEFHVGNNLVSRVPEIYDVLRSPKVHGALVSLLGPNYYFHPHRAAHTSTPVPDQESEYAADHNGPPMGKGSRAGSGWHQDAQSPLSRPRHHTPKYLIAFYFPHDTPEPMGPTRYQAGSYLFSEPVAPTGVVLPDFVKAGSFLILHFDMVHAGWPNRTDLTRYMLKFIFVRTENPKLPTWTHTDSSFALHDDRRVKKNLTPAWQFLWSWLRGKPEVQNGHDYKTSDLNSLDQEARIAAIYTPHEVSDLIARLASVKGHDLHERRLYRNKEGRLVPRDHVIGTERRWNERAIVFDDATYALAAQGAQAVEPLVDELQGCDDPWYAMNLMFALGEIGRDAASSTAEIAAELNHPLQQVVRTALDALGAIGANLDCTFDQVRRLLTEENSDWQDAQVMRGWSGQDQIRLNAVFMLLNALNEDCDREEVEDLFRISLGDRNGYVSAVASEGLIRLGTPTSHATALQFLHDRRWDETISVRNPF